MATYQVLRVTFNGTPYTDHINVKIDGRWIRFGKNNPVDMSEEEWEMIPDSWKPYFSRQEVTKTAISGYEG